MRVHNNPSICWDLIFLVLILQLPVPIFLPGRPADPAALEQPVKLNEQSQPREVNESHVEMEGENGEIEDWELNEAVDTEGDAEGGDQSQSGFRSSKTLFE